MVQEIKDPKKLKATGDELERIFTEFVVELKQNPLFPALHDAQLQPDRHDMGDSLASFNVMLIGKSILLNLLFNVQGVSSFDTGVPYCKLAEVAFQGNSKLFTETQMKSQLALLLRRIAPYYHENTQVVVEFR